MQPEAVESATEVRRLAARHEHFANVDASAIGEVTQFEQMAAVGSPLLTERAMTDFDDEGHYLTSSGLPRLRLEPEIMGDGLASHSQKRHEHGGSAKQDCTPSSLPSLLARAIAGVALITLPQAALAHDGTGLPGGFVAGIEHPLSGLDHTLAMASVGVWGAFLQRPLIYVLPMVFPIMMAIGAGIAMLGVPLPPVEVGIALSLCVLGGLILGAVRAPTWLACTIVGIFALFHGYSHGIELPSAADPIGYSLGFVMATGTLHVIGIAIGAVDRFPKGESLLRLLGGLVSLAGVWFLWAAVA